MLILWSSSLWGRRSKPLVWMLVGISATHKMGRTYIEHSCSRTGVQSFLWCERLIMLLKIYSWFNSRRYFRLFWYISFGIKVSHLLDWNQREPAHNKNAVHFKYDSNQPIKYFWFWVEEKLMGENCLRRRSSAKINPTLLQPQFLACSERE